MSQPLTTLSKFLRTTALATACAISFSAFALEAVNLAGTYELKVGGEKILVVIKKNVDGYVLVKDGAEFEPLYYFNEKLAEGFSQEYFGRSARETMTICYRFGSWAALCATPAGQSRSEGREPFRNELFLVPPGSEIAELQKIK